MNPSYPNPAPSAAAPSPPRKGRSRARGVCQGGGLLAGCLLVAAAGAWGLDRAAWEYRPMPSSPQMPGEANASMTEMVVPGYPTIRCRPIPKGTAAPDFELPDVRDGRVVRLSGLRGRPVVLVFGSFGCNLLCDQAAELARLHSRCKDRAQFLFVYVVEAPHDNPDLPPPWGGGVAADPEEAQKERIRKGFAHYGLTMPCLEDSKKEAVEAYGAWPRRLVLVDASGRIACDAGPGLMGNAGWDLDAFGKMLDQLPEPAGRGG
jgi:hypothetical protein